jgi:Oxidoreductase family, NAD-binding Rossmann fold
MSELGFSRRYFFFGSLLAGAIPRGGFGSAPTLPALGHKPFGEKLNIAVIGCGPQGTADMTAAAHTENIVAVCDVDENRAAAARKKYEKSTPYRDYRVMLDKEGKNIDAVTIAVPDFMHATVALACMERGKHVLSELARPRPRSKSNAPFPGLGLLDSGEILGVLDINSSIGFDPLRGGDKTGHQRCLGSQRSLPYSATEARSP